MGLDMYFYKRKKTYNSFSNCYDQIGYFRKFNALHGYIVKTFADGVDECQEILLHKKDIEQIKKVLDEVLEANTEEKAKEILPTQSGFFFGSTDYDEFYFEDVKDAADLMQNFLDNFDFESYQLVYQASW